jgi:hypothetical protein
MKFRLTVILIAVFLASQDAKGDCLPYKPSVEALYQHLLGRGAASDLGAETWVNEYKNGKTTREIVREITNSEEYRNRIMTEGPPSKKARSAQASVRVEYKTLLGRDASDDEIAKSGWMGVLASAGLGQVNDGFIDSVEYKQKYGDWGVPGSSQASCVLPIQASKDTNFGSYHMITNARLSADGHLAFDTEIREHRKFLGDCGRPHAYLRDAQGNDVLYLRGERSCVDGTGVPFGGPSVRHILWGDVLSSEQMARVRFVIVFHTDDPPPSIEKLNTTIDAAKKEWNDHPEIQQAAMLVYGG